MEVWRTERSFWQEAVPRAKPVTINAGAVTKLNTTPANTDVLTEKGRVYLDLGNPAAALYENSGKLWHWHRTTHVRSTIVGSRCSRWAKTTLPARFRRALAIDPKLQDARQNLARATAAAK